MEAARCGARKIAFRLHAAPDECNGIVAVFFGACALVKLQGAAVNLVVPEEKPGIDAAENFEFVLWNTTPEVAGDKRRIDLRLFGSLAGVRDVLLKPDI
jgi:hypothetical protein